MKIKQTAWLHAMILGSAVFTGSSAVMAQVSTEDCRAIGNDAERLACYDRVNSQPVPAPELMPEPEPAAAPAPAPESTPVAPVETVSETVPEEPQPDVVVLDDEVGSETLDRKDDERDEPLIMGHVRSCKKSSRGKYFFYFDNGQVWKQKDNTRIPWRDCDFDVTIEKDFFGYRMSPVGETRRVRISRVE